MKNPHTWQLDWMDHRYTEVIDGREVWVCHPYHLFGDDLDSLDYLRCCGYQIDVRGNSIYYPGGTLRVEIRPPDGETFPSYEPQEQTWLYRMYDDADNLLYIGISKSAFARFEQHCQDKPWINEVTRWEREQHPTRSAALAAEHKAIKAEHPRYNVVHNQGRIA